MSFIKKIQKMQKDGIISAETAQKMIENEKNKSQNILWENLFRVSAVLIGLGILMVIGANLDNLFNFFYVLSYFALGGFTFGLYKSLIASKKGLRELFAVLSFIMVGAILGLIRQKYQLDFAQTTLLLWTVIGLPYVLVSKSYTFNVIWWLLLNLGIPWEYFYETKIFQVITSWYRVIVEKWQIPLLISVISIIFSALLCLIGTKVYSLIKQRFILPDAFAVWMRFNMYISVIAAGIIFSFGYMSFYLSDTAFMYNKIATRIFVIGFFIYRIWLAYKYNNIPAIKRNVVLLELYIVFFFMVKLRHLFFSGLGLIIIGLLMLGAIYTIRKVHQRFLKPLNQTRGEINE